MRPARLPATLAVFVGAVLTSCGNGGDSATPTPNFAVLAAAAVDDAPIALTDLPTGWTTPTPEEDLTAGLELSAECDLRDLNVVFPGAAAVERSGSFVGPLDQQVASYAAVYQTTEGAVNEMQTIAAMVSRCEEEYKDEVEESAKERLSVLGIDLGVFADMDVSLDEVEAGPLGDESKLYRVNVSVGVPGPDQSFTLDVTVVRVGRVVSAVTYSGYGELDADEERSLNETLVGKMTAANDRLSVAPDGTSGA